MMIYYKLLIVSIVLVHIGEAKKNMQRSSAYSLVTEMSIKWNEKIDHSSWHGLWSKRGFRRGGRGNFVKNIVSFNWLSSRKVRVVRPEMVVSEATPSDEGMYCFVFGFNFIFAHCVVNHLVGSGTWGKVNNVKVYSSKTIPRIIRNSPGTDTLEYYGNVPVSRTGDMIYAMVDGWPRPHVRVLKTDERGVAEKLTSDAYCGYDLTTARVCFWSDDDANNSFTVEAGYKAPFARKSFETRVYTPIEFTGGKQDKEILLADRNATNQIAFECEVTSEPRAVITFYQTTTSSNWQPEYGGTVLTETGNTHIATTYDGNLTKARLTIDGLKPAKRESVQRYICNADNGYESAFIGLIVEWPNGDTDKKLEID